jgi:hypothetical protein
MNTEQQQFLRIGKWIGRGEAFAVNATFSHFAQAKCWKEIHDSGDYKTLGLTWEEFCTEHLGLVRTRVEAIIAGLEEFGENFCRLSEILRVSPETYRAISPKIAGDAIEIDGEMVPIAAENSALIRGAVQRMRAELTQHPRTRPTKDPIAGVQMRLDGCIAAVSRLCGDAVESAQKESIRSLLEGSALRLMELSEKLAA